MHHDHHPDCGCDACGQLACWSLPPEFVRMRYFFGQRLGVVDLTDEQSYHVGKRRFHNAHLHGAGVLCGLIAERFVYPQGAPDNTPTTVVRVRSGAALDGCGREIVVGVDQCVDVDAWFQKNRDRESVLAWFDAVAPAPARLWVAVRYRECPSDPAPAPRDACGGCDQPGCDYARVREGFELALLTDADAKGFVGTSFPTRAALLAALQTGEGLEQALTLAAAAACPEVSHTGWLCLASLSLTFDGTPRRVADVSAPDNTVPERATLLTTAALQGLLVELARTLGADGSLAAGPRLGTLSFAGTGVDAGTLSLAVQLVDDGSGPTALAVGTFDPARWVVHKFDAAAGTWLPASTTTASYQSTPPRVELTFAAGDIDAGSYRLTFDPAPATPLVDAKLRPLRPQGTSRHFDLVVDAATSTLVLA